MNFKKISIKRVKVLGPKWKKSSV